MNVDFEELKKIPQILDVILTIKETVEKGKLDKRWLNTRELANYTGYKFETIQSKIKKKEFIRNVHYFKRDGTLLFDKIEVDNWVREIKPLNYILNSEKKIENTQDMSKEFLSLLST